MSYEYLSDTSNDFYFERTSTLKFYLLDRNHDVFTSTAITDLWVQLYENVPSRQDVDDRQGGILGSAITAYVQDTDGAYSLTIPPISDPQLESQDPHDVYYFGINYTIEGGEQVKVMPVNYSRDLGFLSRLYITAVDLADTDPKVGTIFPNNLNFLPKHIEITTALVLDEMRSKYRDIRRIKNLGGLKTYLIYKTLASIYNVEIEILGDGNQAKSDKYDMMADKFLKAYIPEIAEEEDDNQQLDLERDLFSTRLIR